MKVLVFTPHAYATTARQLLSEFQARQVGELFLVHNSPSFELLIADKSVDGVVVYGTGREEWLLKATRLAILHERHLPIAFIYTDEEPSFPELLTIRRNISNVHDDTAQSYFLPIYGFFRASKSSPKRT